MTDSRMTCDEFRRLHFQFSERMPRPDDQVSMAIYENHIEHMHECERCGTWFMEQAVKMRGVDLADFPSIQLAYYSTVPSINGEDEWDNPDVAVVRRSDGSFGIPIRDGGSSMYEIRFCPWTGIEINPATNSRG